LGYWENTTYVNAAPADVLDTLTSHFVREGMERVASPPKRQRSNYEPMQYAGALHNDLWGVAVFPGAPSWTVVKTAPLELLGERAAGAARPRLADLCSRLSVAAFQVNIYDSTATLLCEVSAQGETCISGYTYSGDAMDWHGERLQEEFIEPRFRLLPYQDVVNDGGAGDDLAFALSAEFGGANASHCDNLTSVAALVTHEHPAIDGGVFAYFRWNGPTRVLVPSSSWDDWRRKKGSQPQGT
jgi:hypothetical protein